MQVVDAVDASARKSLSAGRRSLARAATRQAIDARVANVDEAFAAMVNEARATANFIPDDMASDLSWSDVFFYHIENRMAAHWYTKFNLLGVILLFFQVLYTVLWYVL